MIIHLIKGGIIVVDTEVLLLIICLFEFTLICILWAELIVKKNKLEEIKSEIELNNQKIRIIR
jgi:hypothetical protein